MAYDREYQKRYYQENREERLAQARARNRSMTPEQRAARKEYMRQYRLDHPEKWKRTRKQQDKVNTRKRELYARDEWRRIQARKWARDWQKRNPRKRKAQRLKQYDLTLAEYEKMLSDQGGKCAICGHSDMSNPLYFPIVDHCHATGQVRGLLCMNCNQAIGKFQDSPTLLRSAAKYLEANRADEKS